MSDTFEPEQRAKRGRLGLDATMEYIIQLNPPIRQHVYLLIDPLAIHYALDLTMVG